MNSLKQTAVNAILSMTESVNVDDIMYKLYVIDKIMKGQKDIDNGDTMDIVQLRKEIDQW